MALRNELRAHREELQRVQIGLVGLAAVLLVVTLANLVIQTARGDGPGSNGAPVEQVASGTAGANGAAEPTEPLADLGVTPTADTAAPSVPDLEPDPRLRKRMDRDPKQSQR
ncbi:hypothetical protein [Sphingobium nicotianae]|uniref:Uncharacterized protein n=1 Tax=Sphingobium nicotianae TaxID=2782607 RepID=A0A9X1IS19_9SPHN|nr:hypothetical protein [Sphingobium nicotianae]MBT2188008.1 hypothetical protein [Sphingobium nicotianae]